VKKELLRFKTTRDQIVICYAGLSIARKDPDYDALLIFDEIFTGGSQGSMSSKLFELREQTGLFYTIRGSMLAYADKQPGMMMIKTIVSPDGLQETYKQLELLIAGAADTLTEEDIVTARRGIINNFSTFFVSHKQMATTFLFLERFGFPADFFDTRAAELMGCTLQKVREVAKKRVRLDALAVIEIGH
jgi:predicted Zn-dependent peptidase